MVDISFDATILRAQRTPDNPQGVFAGCDIRVCDQHICLYGAGSSRIQVKIQAEVRLEQREYARQTHSAKQRENKAALGP